MNKIRPQSGLRNGVNEIERLQSAQLENIKELSLFGRIKQFGILAYYDPEGTLSSDFSISDAGGGQISVASGKAINSKYQYFENNSSLTATVTNDSNWYKIKITPSLYQYEKGTVTFSIGTKPVTGSGTKFTEWTSKSGTYSKGNSRGDKIGFDTGSANETDGPWEIDTITDDTNLTLVNNASATETATIFIEPRFDGSAPTEKNLYAYYKTSLSLTTSALTSSDILLGYVKNSGGTLTIIDVRKYNLLELYETKQGSIKILPPISPDPTRILVKSDGTSTQGVILERSDKKLLALYLRGDTNIIYSHYCELGGTAYKWLNTAPVTVTTGGGNVLGMLSGIALPNGYVFCSYYTDIGSIATNYHAAVKISTDNGATWGGAQNVYENVLQNVISTAMLYDPATNYIYLFVTYNVIATGAGRCLVYRSSDLGTTWSNVGVFGSNIIEHRCTSAILFNNKIIAGCINATSPGIRIYESSDYGVNWTCIASETGGQTELTYFGYSQVSWTLNSNSLALYNLNNQTIALLFSIADAGAGTNTKILALYSKNGTTWEDIQIITENTGHVEVNMPGVLTSQQKLKIPTYYDKSIYQINLTTTKQY